MKHCSIKLKKGNIPDYKFNKSQLLIGIKVEKEHTNNNSVAKQIAKAHLSEMDDYYTKLARMERTPSSKYRLHKKHKGFFGW
jgi:hypothetical protein